jgi:hypothetical protein
MSAELFRVMLSCFPSSAYWMGFAGDKKRPVGLSVLALSLSQFIAPALNRIFLTGNVQEIASPGAVSPIVVSPGVKLFSCCRVESEEVIDHRELIVPMG